MLGSTPKCVPGCLCPVPPPLDPTPPTIIKALMLASLYPHPKPKVQGHPHNDSPDVLVPLPERRLVMVEGSCR